MDDSYREAVVVTLTDIGYPRAKMSSQCLGYKRYHYTITDLQAETYILANPSAYSIYVTNPYMGAQYETDNDGNIKGVYISAYSSIEVAVFKSCTSFTAVYGAENYTEPVQETDESDTAFAVRYAQYELETGALRGTRATIIATKK